MIHNPLCSAGASGGVRIDPHPHNRSLFREVNERIRNVNGAFGAVDSLQLVCECRSIDCAQPVAVPTTVYEAIRPAGDRFVVAPGHESVHDHVVAAEGDYAVVIDSPGTSALEA